MGSYDPISLFRVARVNLHPSQRGPARARFRRMPARDGLKGIATA